MSDQNFTRQRCFPVRHWVTVAFLTPFFCVLNFGGTLSARCRHPLLCGSLPRFLWNLIPPFRRVHVLLCPLRGLQNTHMIACQIKSLLQSAALGLFSGVIIIYCRHGTPAWMGWPPGVFGEGPLICIPVAFVVG